MKISYEYKVEKIAFVFDGKENQPVGHVEQDVRNGDDIKITIKFFPNVPKDLLDLLQENPTVMNIKEVKTKAHQVVLLPEGSDLLIKP